MKEGSIKAIKNILLANKSCILLIVWEANTMNSYIHNDLWTRTIFGADK